MKLCQPSPVQILFFAVPIRLPMDTLLVLLTIDEDDLAGGDDEDDDED